MNLRTTIAGAAIALGGATVMLGLGGTANAAVDGVVENVEGQTVPTLLGYDNTEEASNVGVGALVDGN